MKRIVNISLFILFLLMSLFNYNCQNSGHGDLIKRTMGDLKAIGNAIESFMTDQYHAPEGDLIIEIQSKLEPYHIKKLPLKDAWGNYFLYQNGTGSDKDLYSVASAGSDGKFNGFNQKGFYYASPDDGNDIVYSNGNFIYGPKMK